MDHLDFTPPPPSAGLIGHRGIAALAPENTLSGFMLAAEQDIDWVEFDVQLTKDNGLVIFHDDKLERTSNGKGLVHKHTLNDLSDLDAGSWFSSEFKGERIPVFQEILPKLLKLKLFLNIELKVPTDASKRHCETLANLVADSLSKQWPAKNPWPLISSFNWDLLTIIRARLPQAPIGFLHDHCSQEMIEMVANTPNASLNCNFESLTDEMLAISKDFSIPVLAYTVNQPDVAKRLLDAGIFGLFSDDPLRLHPYIPY